MTTVKKLAHGLNVSLLALGFAALTSTAQAEGSLNIYNWSDYIDESVLKDFEEKHAIKVTYDVFDSNEVLETKLLAGSSGYDVVVPSAYFLSRQIEAGVFEKLDKSKLPNLSNMDSFIMERTATSDPHNAYSINYLWGTTGIGYVEEKIKEIMPDAPVDSWDIIFKPEIASKFADCGIYLLDGPTEIIPAALAYLGLNVQEINSENLKKAEELIAPIRPFIRKFHSSEYISALANGDICLAVGWSGDIFQAQSRAEEADNGVTVQYRIPKEGAQMWMDQMAIPADAKNKEQAYTFINYMMEPKVIAKVSNYVAYANGNAASKEFIDAEVLENPAIYPTEEMLERLYVLSTYDAPSTRLINRSWTRIKSGR